jgi:hypothetical protein
MANGIHVERDHHLPQGFDLKFPDLSARENGDFLSCEEEGGVG